jgi:hypothetical protein
MLALEKLWITEQQKIGREMDKAHFEQDLHFGRFAMPIFLIR